MDRVITNSENDAIIAEVKKEVIDLMSGRPLFAQ
jgi:hypothetical protein